MRAGLRMTDLIPTKKWSAACRAGLPRLPSTNGQDDARRERQKVSAGVVDRERPNASRDNKQLSSCRQYSTALDHSATSLFVLPINEQQQVSLASLVDRYWVNLTAQS